MDPSETRSHSILASPSFFGLHFDVKEDTKPAGGQARMTAIRSFAWRSISPLFAREHLRDIYLGVLAREPDSDGTAGYIEKLRRTGSPTAVITDLLHSEEFQRKNLAFIALNLVQALYRGILGREADAEGIATYTRKLVEGADLEGLSADLIKSDEFRLKSIETLSPDLVNAAYKGILRRDPDPAGFTAHNSRLMNDHDITALLSGMAESDEFRQVFERRNPGKRVGFRDLQALKTIFLHIPKTGGTTLHEALKPCFEPAQICPERFDCLYRHTLGELAGYRFFSGHFSFESCELIPGPKRIFTMLRHPVDRLVSQYNFNRAHNDQVIRQDELWLADIARRHTMREFFSVEEVRRHPSINNTMVRMLASWLPADRWESAADIGDDSDANSLLPLARERLQSFAAFGILERYQESLGLIFGTLGLQSPPTIQPKMVLRDLMGTVQGIESIEPQACDRETREVLAPLIETDLCLV